MKVPEFEIEFRFARSSGPGGQNVNKVNTKAILRWGVSESTAIPPGVRRRFLSRYANRITTDGYFLISSDRYRDQSRNKADCLEKLEQLLQAVAQPPKRRKATKPSKAAKKKRLEQKKKHGDKKRLRQRVRD